MYDFSWHQIHSDKTKKAAEIILSILIDILTPRSILDVGCGDGIWLQKASELGFLECKGVDGAWTKLDKLFIPPQSIVICDLEKRFDLSRRFDVAISLEVAEHISNNSAEIVVENLVMHSDVVLFGAAIPYQGGFRHINERWQSWWAAKFAAKGYKCFDIVRPQIWRRDDVHFWYKQNTLVYVNRDKQDCIDYFEEYIVKNSLSQYPLDIVHPEKYEAAASYRQIAFKPLLRELPSAVSGKIKDILSRKI